MTKKNNITAHDQLVHSGKDIYSDVKADKDLCGQQFINIYFERFVAKDKNFTQCDFRYCNFSDAYFRRCHFEDCDFTGARFSDSNLIGSTFDGCKFDYTDFHRTHIEPNVLDTCCPDRENIKLRFARSLRTNYQSLGEAKYANKAMNVELAATEEHHRKSWKSNDRYYRRKYKGIRRARCFYEWIEFKFLDFLWGNGESLWRLFRLVLLLSVTLSTLDFILKPEPMTFAEAIKSFGEGWLIFLSFSTPEYFSDYMLSFVYVARLIIFALFVSILVKRFSRR